MKTILDYPIKYYYISNKILLFFYLVIRIIDYAISYYAIKILKCAKEVNEFTNPFVSNILLSIIIIILPIILIQIGNYISFYNENCFLAVITFGLISLVTMHFLIILYNIQFIS